MKLGERIRIFRTTKGYSQETMGNLLGLSITGYGKIERGETSITLLRLEEIAKVLNVRVEAIIQFNDTGSPPLPSSSHTQGIGTATRSTSVLVYESRIRRLEDDLQEVRRLLTDLLKKNA